MTEAQFDNGYWYAVEVKAFAKDLGIPAPAKLRKDELEKLIRHFLRTGKIKSPSRKNLKQWGLSDNERGLSLSLPIVRYTSNRETKDFIVREALKLDPHLRRKSGARYRLNRWREEKINRGVKITYLDLVKQYLKLNQVEGRFAQAPTGRYINFLSDFLSTEENATRAAAIKAWHELKKLDIPKNYQAWKKYRRSTSKAKRR
jgi:SAP domain-containing new25